MTDLYELVVEAMRRHSLDGVAVAVVQKGKPHRFVCCGPAAASGNRPITPATGFRIASISKTMTAVGLMQLRDRGLFDLDEPVNRYLKGLTVLPPQGAPDVTFRHMLTHTSGIGEVPRVSDLVRREAWGLTKPGRPADLLALYGGTLRTEVEAATKWAYANHAFAVLGQAVEDISGQPFAEYMQQHVFEPLGMPSTEYGRTDRTAGEFASGHHWLLGRFAGVKDYDLTLQGAGSVISSATDMATYAAWLAGSGDARRPRVLRASTMAEMRTPQYSVDPRLPGMGLAFFLSRFGDHDVFGHDGSYPGYASALLVAPGSGTGVVVLTNTATVLGAHRLASSVLRELLGVADPLDNLPHPRAEVQPHLWPDLVGCYAPRPGFLTNLRMWQMLGGEVQVGVRRRHLTLRALSPIPPLARGVELHRVDENDPLHFAVAFEGVDVEVAFVREGTGSAARLVIGPPVNAILYRRPMYRSSRLRLRIAAAASVAAVVRARSRRHRLRHPWRR